MIATVKKWFPERGFGFLQNPEQDGPDIFLHKKHLERPDGHPAPSLYPGDVLDFELIKNHKGLNAEKAKKVKAK